jgi:hypothetical protein
MQATFASGEKARGATVAATLSRWRYSTMGAYVSRDSKNPHGAILWFTPTEWGIFIGRIQM